jgi:hypothetical protein
VDAQFFVEILAALLVGKHLERGLDPEETIQVAAVLIVGMKARSYQVKDSFERFIIRVWCDAQNLIPIGKRRFEFDGLHCIRLTRNSVGAS